MNELFKKNRQVLERRFPAVAQLLERCASEPCDVILSTADGYSELSSYPKIVFCYGIGSGEHIVKLYPTLDLITKHILIVERIPAFFLRSLERLDWVQILEDERVQLAIGLDESEMEPFFSSYLNNVDRLISIHTVNNIFDQTSLRLSGPYYETMADKLKSVADLMGSYAQASPEDTYRGFLNIIQNMPGQGAAPLFDSLEGAFRGFPGVSIAAGPSLKKSIPWLRKIQDRAVIISTDVSLKTLLENGIVPHAVTCLERVPETKFFFQDLPPLNDTWLIANPVIWPETYALYPGPKIHMIRQIGQLLYFFPDAKIYDAGNSSAHINYVALERMGCSPIMLVGQDLAYDRHSYETHGTAMPSVVDKFERKMREQCAQQAQDPESECLVEGNDGKPILTMPWFNNFRKVFEAFIRRSPVTCFNVIPEDYGAKIAHSVRIDPEEAAQQLGKPLSVAAMIRQRLALQPRPNPLVYRNWLQGRFAQAIEMLHHYHDIAVEVMDAVSSFRHRYDPTVHEVGIFEPFLKKIQQIAQDLSDDEDRVYDTFFLAQIQHRTFGLTQVGESILTVCEMTPEQIENQIALVQEWFSTILLWASRMEGHMLKNAALYLGDDSRNKEHECSETM